VSQLTNSLCDLPDNRPAPDPASRRDCRGPTVEHLFGTKGGNMIHHHDTTSLGEKIITVVGFVVLTLVLFVFMVAFQMTV
jgi:hypothetical protein